MISTPGLITFSRYTRTASGVLLPNAKPRSDFRRDAKALWEMFGVEECNAEVLWAAGLASGNRVSKFRCAEPETHPERDDVGSHAG